MSSATDLAIKYDSRCSTVSYEFKEKQTISLSFGVHNCDNVNVSTKNSNIKNIVVSHKDNNMSVDCEIIENSQISTISISSSDEEMTQEGLPSPPKKSALTVNLEIKNKKTSEENSKVLILKTDSIEKLSHVIVQPPNYKLVKRKISDQSKLTNSGKKKRSGVKGEKAVSSVNFKQKPIDGYLSKSADVIKVSEKTFVGFKTEDVICNDGQDMSKNLGVADAVKTERNGRTVCKVHRKDNEASPRSIKVVARRESPRAQGVKLSSSEAPGRAASRSRNDSASSAHSPRRNVDSVQFNLPKSRSNRNSISPKHIPHYKIVAGDFFLLF